LRGCYAFFHVADPKNHIRELNERNNSARVFVKLPSAQVVSACPRSGSGGVG
jgi:subtilase family serine protease